MSSDAAVVTAPAGLVIEAHNVGKCYHIYDRPSHRLLQGLVGGSKQYYREFWALRHIDLTVERGQTVGIIGRNGSGKSTLLQMLAGTLTPTEGSISVQGRVAALLELGSGFNPEFTGLENVYLNAAILGLGKAEVDESLDRILSFADIGEFIHQPIRNYSSGMVVRLAFAVQAQVHPQLLIVDEALSVGDAKFQAKCFARLKQLKDDGASILLVSHSADQIVQHCDRALLLDGGRAVLAGSPKSVVHKYYDLLFGVGNDKADGAESEDGLDVLAIDAPFASEEDECADRFATRPNFNPHEFRWGDGRARVLDFELRSAKGLYPTVLDSGSALRLALRVKFNEAVVHPILGITVKTKEGVAVYGTNTEMKPVPAFTSAGSPGTVVDVVVEFKCNLADGDYFISVGVASRNEEAVVPHDRRYDCIHIKVLNADFFGMGDLGMSIAPFQADH